MQKSIAKHNAILKELACLHYPSIIDPSAKNAFCANSVHIDIGTSHANFMRGLYSTPGVAAFSLVNRWNSSSGRVISALPCFFALQARSNLNVDGLCLNVNLAWQVGGCASLSANAKTLSLAAIKGASGFDEE